MSSWMKTLQSGANKVGNEAAKLKLYAEISLLKGDIKSLKEAWGVTCFDLYSQGDANGVNASHAKQLVKIREKEAKVQAKIVELNKLKLHGTIRVPLYITQQRRNAMGVGMMMEADLDTDEHPSHWVLQGTALCLNIDV